MSRRILVLTPYLYGSVPGPRSSIELWERVLTPAGINFDYAPFGDERLHDILYEPGQSLRKATRMLTAYGRRMADVRRVREYDAVLIYREAALLGPEVFERLVSAAGVPIIYQLDDPLYVPYVSPSNGYFSYLHFFGKVGRIARLSALTIVNSRHHWNYVSRYTSRIHLMPILVDGAVYQPRPRDSRSPATVGWSGSPTTAENLRLILGPLARLSARPDVEVRLIGGGHYDLPGVRFTSVPWSAETEIDELHRLDVGLLPAPETEWTKRKFFMKLIQYMSLGIPPICTPIGANPEVVEHGENGLLVSGDQQWEAAMRRLVDDEELRRRMGENAARIAHARYTLQARADELIKMFSQVVGAP